MITIERLKPAELLLCLEGGFEFFSEGKLPGGFVPDVFIDTFSGLIDSGQGIVLASFVMEGHKKVITGALGAVLAPNPFNGRLMAVENFWYSLPQHRGHGLRLLYAFERWAVERKAEFVCMIHLTKLQPEALGKLYERMGYSMIETNYIKAL